MVLSGSTACTDVLGQVTQQLLTCKKIVKADMMILSLQVLCEVFDNPMTQLLFVTALIVSVHLEFIEISIMAVSKGPYLDVSLHCLQQHVLLQGRATCKLYHCFVDRYVLVWIIEVREAR